MQDTPVGTGNSYEDDASSGNGVWSMAQTTFPLLRGAFLHPRAPQGAHQGDSNPAEQPPHPPLHLWWHLRWQDQHRRRTSHPGWRTK